MDVGERGEGSNCESMQRVQILVSPRRQEYGIILEAIGRRVQQRKFIVPSVSTTELISVANGRMAAIYPA